MTDIGKGGVEPGDRYGDRFFVSEVPGWFLRQGLRGRGLAPKGACPRRRGGDMPRSARRVADGGVYHILNRGNGQQRVFQKDGDYLAFIELLGQMRERYSIDLLAYCLIPNHFHLLVKVDRGEDLSRGMQWFMTTHVRRYHRHYHSSGHLWQGRYKSFGIEDDDHLLTVARYVEGNPVRAGLVDTAKDWQWSSHRERCEQIEGEGDSPSGFSKGLSPSHLLSPLPIALPQDWTAFVDTPLTGRELAKVRKKIVRQTGESGGLAP